MAATKQRLSAAFVTVSDAVGFVGAFRSVAQARDALRPYRGVPFVYYTWKRRRETISAADEDLVWALPYKANNAIAYASDVKAEAETVQKDLSRLGLVHNDDVKYWEAVVGEVPAPVKLRLDAVLRALHASTAAKKDVSESVSNAGNTACAKGASLFGGDTASEGEKKDSETVSRFLDFVAHHNTEEPARINLLEGVVPVALAPAAAVYD
ncbi:hypothetical protein ElyMa_002595200 [Elysia marginata]|uniref:Uncharacterized protein n=1 Tax=Elysia marginata TaxID=1093978 RepID=A0AAV4H045_9GAST|nr:hypothetical protein ElyMa_002595200 [Elysia marginata]